MTTANTKRRNFLIRAIIAAATAVTVLPKLVSDASAQNQPDAQAAAEPATPTGTIVAFAGVTVPVGWDACDGKTCSISDRKYAGLFKVIKDAYGNDGVEKFKLPNLNNGSFPRGSATVGQRGGSDSHSHIVTNQGPNHGSGFQKGGNSYLGTSDGQNHLPPFLTVQFIIKL